MKNQTIKYKGSKYQIRTIEIRDKVDNQILKLEIKIASKELNKIYDESRMSIHGSDEQKLDASIDYYVSKETMESLPDVITGRDVNEILVELMSCEEEFELVEAEY